MSFAIYKWDCCKTCWKEIPLHIKTTLFQRKFLSQFFFLLSILQPSVNGKHMSLELHPNENIAKISSTKVQRQVQVCPLCGHTQLLKKCPLKQRQYNSLSYIKVGMPYNISWTNILIKTVWGKKLFLSPFLPPFHILAFPLIRIFHLSGI